MTAFVLDNSVAMRWLLKSNKNKDQKYAEDVLKSLANTEALVPHVWHLEAVHVLLNAQKRGEVDSGEIEQFIAQLESLSIQVDSLTSHQAFNRTLALSRAYNISSYDASYLELAIRAGLPLATLDKALTKAVRRTNVDIYLRTGAYE